LQAHFIAVTLDGFILLAFTCIRISW